MHMIPTRKALSLFPIGPSYLLDPEINFARTPQNSLIIDKNIKSITYSLFIASIYKKGKYIAMSEITSPISFNISPNLDCKLN